MNGNLPFPRLRDGVLVLAVSFLPTLTGLADAPREITEEGGSYTECLLAGFNLVGVQLFDPVVAGGVIDAEVGRTITDADADFVVALSEPRATYLVEILDGPQAGAVAEIIDGSITANGFEVAEPLGAGLATYQIRPAPTLDGVFGSQLEGAPFFPGATTDLIWLPTDGGSYELYFYSSTAGEFRSLSRPFAAPAKPVPVFYPDAFFVEVRGAPKDVVITGVLKRTDTLVVVKEGFNLVAVNPPLGATLGNSGLDEFLVGRVVPGFGADIVWMPDGAGGFQHYFFSSNFMTWRNTSSPFAGDESETELRSGIMIQRQAENGTGAGLLTVPPFYSDP